MKLSASAEATAAKRTPLRSEVAQEDTWDLTPLFADDAGWEEAFESLRRDYKTIESFRGRIAESASVLRDALECEKAVDLQVETLNQFVALRTTEDSSNSGALAREARFQALMVQVGEAFSFLGPEIQELDDAKFEAFVTDPILSEWTVPLRKLRRLKAHTLSGAEERLLALGSATVGGHHETFSQLTNVDMRYGTVRDAKGRDIELTQSSFSSLLQQRDRAVRQDAFTKFYAEFADHKFTLASAFASSVRGDVFYARARNYPSAIEAALFRDDVPVDVYDSLIESVRKNLPALHKYYALRKRVMRLDDIHVYDTYVPLVEGIETNIDWNGAVDHVLAAVKPLGDEYIATLSHGLREGRWCDRYENKGKRSGAFSYGTYTSPPYIMMNYKSDVFSDVFTLAHEAGHSMHTWYSKHAQSFQNYHYPIFLAEVASTFNEMLLTNHLLAETTDPRMRAYLISRQIDDFRGTLYRQTMFAEFEKKVHAVEEAGDALTLETMQSIYRELLEAYFGPDFALDEALSLECLRIPHFYNAFYVYKYATGLSAAVALSQQVLQSGDASRYIRFLKSGGVAFPIDTLRDAGVDMRTPAAVDSALALFAQRVDELETLLASTAV
jgi:oligoendopeptidase F